MPPVELFGAIMNVKFHLGQIVLATIESIDHLPIEGYYVISDLFVIFVAIFEFLK